MGPITMPNDPSEFIGDHCIDLVGYANARFKFANCWGAKWGDNGYGYLPFDYFNRYLIDAFDIIPGQFAPSRIRSLLKSKKGDLKGWCIMSPLGVPLHGVELWDRSHDERKGWTFAVERDGFLDVEELFVRPAYRMRGLGRLLLNQIRRHAEERQLPLRCWVPHGDCPDEKSRRRLSRFLGLPLLPSQVTWADFVGSEIVQAMLP